MRHTAIFPVLLGLAITVAPASAQTIKKCQDANGKWHYGDFAAQECERSLVTEINQQGVKVDEDAPPPTREELQAERDAAQAAAEAERAQKEQREADRRLLATYDSEETLLRTRDQRLQALDSEVKSLETFMGKAQDRLQQLQAGAAQHSANEASALKAQIDDYVRAIDERLRDRDAVSERFDSDLQRYRELVQSR